MDDDARLKDLYRRVELLRVQVHATKNALSEDSQCIVKRMHNNTDTGHVSYALAASGKN